MRAFDYVSAGNTKQAVGLLGATWGHTEVIAGGTDLLALMGRWSAGSCGLLQPLPEGRVIFEVDKPVTIVDFDL